MEKADALIIFKDKSGLLSTEKTPKFEGIIVWYIYQCNHSFQYVDTGSCKGDSGAALFEFVKGKNHRFMVAYGVVHGCLGKCCSIDYPSVFTSLGDKDVLRFLNGVGIAINVANIAIIDKNNTPVYVGIIISLIIISLLMVIGFFYRKSSNLRYETFLRWKF